MKWPWVSRARLEDTERRLAESDAERRKLLNRLLDRDESMKMPGRVSIEEDSYNPVPFTTPFDKKIRDFEMAGAKARQPQFKARVR